MGVSIGFGIGPVRVSTRLGGRRRSYGGGSRGPSGPPMKHTPASIIVTIIVFIAIGVFGWMLATDGGKEPVSMTDYASCVAKTGTTNHDKEYCDKKFPGQRVAESITDCNRMFGGTTGLVAREQCWHDLGFYPDKTYNP